MKQRLLDFCGAKIDQDEKAKLGDRELVDASNGQLVGRILGNGDYARREFFDAINLARLPMLLCEDSVATGAGLTPNDCQKLRYSIELGRRVAEHQSMTRLPRVQISSSNAATLYCRECFAHLLNVNQEEFHILTLDTKNGVIDRHLISIGTLNASLVHPREVFRPAIVDSAASIIAIHNHPSGDPTPSREDRTTTARLTSAGECIGIDLLDHIIVARDGVVSVRESAI